MVKQTYISIIGDFSWGAVGATPKSEFFRLIEGLDPIVEARDLDCGSRSLEVLRSPEEQESLMEGTPPNSSLLVRRLSRWSNELVSERFAFMKIPLPPRYWFKNSVLCSTVSCTCLCCFDSQCALSNIMRNWFCSPMLCPGAFSAPWYFSNTNRCSSSAKVDSIRLKIIYCVFLSLSPSTSEHSLWYQSIGQCSQEYICAAALSFCFCSEHTRNACEMAIMISSATFSDWHLKTYPM